MENQKDKKKTGKISQLKGKNKDLIDEEKSDKAAIVRLEKEADLKRKYEESQNRFETIFYKSNLGNKIISSELKIIQVNKVFIKLMGYTKKELVGTTVTKYAHPDFLHHWVEFRESLWTKKIPSFQIDTCLVKKNGSSFWCQVNSIVFRDNDVDLGYTIVEDISKRKALELKLEKVNEYQKTILHMVAHDLQGPIHNIKSLSDLIKKNQKKLMLVESKEKDESLSMLNMISDTCDKAYAIISDLLFMGELKSKITLKKTNLKIFISSLLPILKVEARKKKIKIKFNYPEKPIYANINEDKFTRVLENLLSNAVKFTNAGGIITLTIKIKSQKVILKVSDNGIGIPDNLKDGIFDKFTKSNRKGTAGETTTGLGLYIVKEIVEMHKGKIWVESQENIGTSFFIELI